MYIHLSKKAFYQTVVECKDDNIEFHRELELPEKYNFKLVESAGTFTQFVKLHTRMFDTVVESKNRFDLSNNKRLKI